MSRNSPNKPDEQKIEPGAIHTENVGPTSTGGTNNVYKDPKMSSLTARLENPLDGIPKEQLMTDARSFADANGLSSDRDLFARAALLAQNPLGYQEIEELTAEDRNTIERETTHKWDQPFMLYWLTIACAMAAVVQGMDETVVNGAQLYYTKEFGIDGNDILIGLVNSAPYLCCVVLGCWLTDPMNRLLGRRGTIFLSCAIAAAASIWEAFTYSTWQLFAARFVLGLGIGPKSATVPVFTAECAPAPIRGALVMMWQMWTAFGIMLGYIVSAIFVDVQPRSLAWRLMLGSTVVAPLLVCAQIYFCPESPRWYIKNGENEKAFKALCRLRPSKLQAAKDLYYMDTQIKLETEAQKGKNLLKEMITVPRNRRALHVSFIVMFMQQFCGINVISYYSSRIFVDSGFTEKQGILASLGAGAINWLGAIPAVYTIDTFGRRNLLLVTFPLMALCLLFIGLCFLIDKESAPNLRIGLIALGIYLFEAVYSPGEGPVPFTYSAEVFPLYTRDLGMSFATATTWGFNFILALTWPKLQRAFTNTGAFGFYAAWNIVGWVNVYFFMRETKGLTLEELDGVFSVPTMKFARYQLEYLPWYLKKYLLRKKNLPPKRDLYQLDEKVGNEEAQA